MDSLQTLTVYRDSGELQLNGIYSVLGTPLVLLTFFKTIAPPIQNARIDSELIVYGILGFIRLQAGKENNAQKHKALSELQNHSIRRIHDCDKRLLKNWNNHARL